MDSLSTSTISVTPAVSTGAQRYVTFTGNHRGSRSLYDACLNRGLSSGWEDSIIEECGRLNHAEESKAIDIAKAASSTGRYALASTLKGWAFVVDCTDWKIVSLLRIDIATECMTKLNDAERDNESYALEQLAHEAAGTARDLQKNVAKLDDSSLVDLAAVFSKAASAVAGEITRRNGPVKPEPAVEITPEFYFSSEGYEPDAETRDELESRIEVTADNVPPVDPYFDELDAAVGIGSAA